MSDLRITANKLMRVFSKFGHHKKISQNISETFPITIITFCVDKKLPYLCIKSTNPSQYFINDSSQLRHCLTHLLTFIRISFVCHVILRFNNTRLIHTGNKRAAHWPSDPAPWSTTLSTDWAGDCCGKLVRANDSVCFQIWKWIECKNFLNQSNFYERNKYSHLINSNKLL